MDAELQVHPRAVVCNESIITGSVTIGADSVVHPKAIIRATKGPIVIGERNLIEETALIENTNEDGAPLVIGDDNYVEIGAVVRARSIGSRNVFGIQCVVGAEVIVTDACSIGVRCSVLKRGDLAPRTCVYGEHNQRRTAAIDPEPPTSLLEVLRKVFPSYHHLKKATVSSA
ncbi:dnc-6 [Pristionchus pacificus]|uniref:Dynactin subunit 6 n=1 Tax=Pristionchus pacificus TaxID=54126 RepID=A0A2A6BFW2_PRIPA|nr:dnc-6 [Pristionchus pacificus]|eukprot:PDM64746.1 dnc-6 [Pristionchus pacificus]